MVQDQPDLACLRAKAAAIDNDRGQWSHCKLPADLAQTNVVGNRLEFRGPLRDDRVVTENEIGSPGTNFSFADIRFSTIGLGYAYYPSDHLKFILYYDIVNNKPTQLTGFEDDLKDNILTCRLQFRF